MPRKLQMLIPPSPPRYLPCREAQDQTKQGHNRGKIVLMIGE